MARPKQFDEQQALDACTEQFWSHSYAGTSTEDLCRCSNLSRSSLYNTFRSKSELYLAALQHYDAVKSRQRSAYVDHPGGAGTSDVATTEGTGLDALEQLLLEVVAEQQSDPARRACLVLNAAVEVGPADPDVARVTRGNLQAFQDVIAGLVRRGQEDGSVTTTMPPDALAGVLHAALNGIAVRNRVASEDQEARRCVARLLELVTPTPTN